MKILIDMNLSPLWAGFLAERGIEALHWSTLGEAAAADSLILDYAASHGFVLFTHDLDFGMLLALRKARAPSVIQVRTQDVLPSALGAVILRVIAATRDDLEAGAIVSVDLARNRIRRLPI
jgi:predicted nuclease of predicted toxin-antitoxin system